MSRAKDPKFVMESQKVFMILRKVGLMVFILCLFAFLFVGIKSCSAEKSKEKKVSVETSIPSGVVKVIAPSGRYSTEEIFVGSSIYWNAPKEKGLEVMFRRNGMVLWTFQQPPRGHAGISSGNMKKLQGATIHFRSLSEDQPVYLCTTRRACGM